MSASTTAPVTIEISRGRLFGLIAGVAAVAAAITWAVGSATGTESAPVQVSAPASNTVVSSPIPSTGYLDAIARSTLSIPPTGYLNAVGSTWVRNVTSMTPVQLIEAFGTDVKAATVLASLTPQERRYVESIMALTPEQLAAGAAGATGK